MKPTQITAFRDKYSWLSNFFKVEVRVDGDIYPSSEHAYMSFKSNDPKWKAQCRDFLISPGTIKKLSKSIELVPNWDDIKIDVMRKVLEAKFSIPAFGNALIATGDAYIMEGNSWNDTFWGVDESTGIGLNHLGILLMEVRSKLQAS